MGKSFLVLGLGRFGMTVAKTLCDLGHEVIGVDGDEKIVREFARHITEALEADVTSEDFLKSLDVDKFDSTVVAVGENFQVSIMATILLKEMGARHIMVKAQDDFQERVLYKLGADKIVLPERDTGAKVALSLAANSWFDMIEISPDFSIVKLTAPASWQEKSLGELAVRAKYGVNIIAVNNGDEGSMMPTADTRLTKGSEITVMGHNNDLKRLSKVH